MESSHKLTPTPSTDNLGRRPYPMAYMKCDPTRPLLALFSQHKVRFGSWEAISMSNSKSSGYHLHSNQPVEIRVYDSTLRPVDRGVGTLERKDLPPGIYRVELRAGSSSDEKLIRLEPGQIYEDLNLQLFFSSVVPLPSTRTFDQQHLAALQDLSVRLRVPAPTATTELVVFLRVVS